VSDDFTSDLLLDARCEFHSLLELLGTASGQLREAASDNDMGNTQGALVVIDDFLSTVTELEHKLSEIAMMAARWTIWAKAAQEAKP
jgi:hypothetical protein